MSEEREYGLEDGYNDAIGGSKPAHVPNAPDAGEYEIAYAEGYQRGAAERAETAAS